MSSHMVMSTETEFGIYTPGNPGADPVDLSCRITRLSRAVGPLRRVVSPFAGTIRLKIL